MSAAHRQPAPRRSLAKMHRDGKNGFLSLREADERTACRRPRPVRRRGDSVASEAGKRRRLLREELFAERHGPLEPAGITRRDALRLPEIIGLPGRRRETFGHASRFATRPCDSAFCDHAETRALRKKAFLKRSDPRTDLQSRHCACISRIPGPSLDMIRMIIHVSFRPSTTSRLGNRASV